LLIIMALFIVGTSMAQGTVANSNIPVSFVFGGIGIGAAFLKFYAMRRFANISLKHLAAIGLFIIVSCNFLGPSFMARSISLDPTGEASRRTLWLFIWVSILAGGVFVIFDAMKTTLENNETEERPFLQRPAMIYIVALILLAGSAVHQYSMAFTFVLERVHGDFVPVILVGSLLFTELLRHIRKRFGIAELIICLLPLAAMMVSIWDKSVLGQWEFGLGVLWYPPVLLGICGLVIAAYAKYYRQMTLFYVVFAYIFGVILTAGFSLEDQHDLNFHFCALTLSFSLFVYGAIIRKQYLCLGSIVVLCFDLAFRDNFLSFAQSNGLTEIGCLAGVCGFGILAIYLLFDELIHKLLPLIGAVFTALFVYDFLPTSASWKYVFVFAFMFVFIGLIWRMRRNFFVMAILSVPLFVRLYILAKYLGHWRYVILGFCLLGVGTVVSLFKDSLSASGTASVINDDVCE
jgi:hypothetical protein